MDVSLFTSCASLFSRLCDPPRLPLMKSIISFHMQTAAVKDTGIDRFIMWSPHIIYQLYSQIQSPFLCIEENDTETNISYFVVKVRLRDGCILKNDDGVSALHKNEMANPPGSMNKGESPKSLIQCIKHEAKPTFSNYIIYLVMTVSISNQKYIYQFTEAYQTKCLFLALKI